MTEFYHVPGTPHNPTNYFYAVYADAEYGDGWKKAVAVTQHTLTATPANGAEKYPHQYNIGVDSFTMEQLRERNPIRMQQSEFLKMYALAITDFNVRMGVSDIQITFKG